MVDLVWITFLLRNYLRDFMKYVVILSKELFDCSVRVDNDE